MATYTDTDEDYLYFAIKKLLNFGHLSTSNFPGQDGDIDGSAGVVPNHVILTASDIGASELSIPAPELADLATDGTVIRFGDSVIPPCCGLELLPLTAVPDNQAWAAIDGVSDTDPLYTDTGTGTRFFLDSWVDGANPVQNSLGFTYEASLWHGQTAPETQLERDHPSRPIWDPTTGILIFGAGDPYLNGIPTGHKVWFVGYLYDGDSLQDRIDDSTLAVNPVSWEKFTTTVVAGGGVGAANTPVTYTLSNATADAEVAAVYHNGLLQQKDIDYTLSGTQLVFLQANQVLAVGDELQALYPVV